MIRSAELQVGTWATRLGGARLAHIQVIMWIAGQKGSDFVNWHIPVSWK
jgi:hypothetical protein